jgi:4-coumarate--CoA ligase
LAIDELRPVHIFFQLSGANPTYTVDELVYQLTSTKATLVFTHPASLEVALAATKKAGIAQDRIILYDTSPLALSAAVTVNDLINEGLRRDAVFVERKLKKGEWKTKIAFLSFSSGTTGKPKVMFVNYCDGELGTYKYVEGCCNTSYLAYCECYYDGHA